MKKADDTFLGNSEFEWVKNRVRDGEDFEDNSDKNDFYK